MPEARDLIHVPGEDVILGHNISRHKEEFRGRKGRFVRYDLVEVEVDGNTLKVTPQNVFKVCPSCNLAASAHPEEPCPAS